MNDTEPTTVTEAKAVVRIFEGKLHRAQRGHGKTFIDGPPSPPPEPVRRPARVAVMLALAHKIQDAIDRGVVRDRAEVARRLGLTRARLTQLMDLTLLAPDLQQGVLALEAVDGSEPMSERVLRGVVHAGSWVEQRATWTKLTGWHEDSTLASVLIPTVLGVDKTINTALQQDHELRRPR
jgi:hypothetical protein